MQSHLKILFLLLSAISIPSLNSVCSHGQLLPVVSRCEDVADERDDVYVVHIRKPNETTLLSPRDRETYYDNFLRTALGNVADDRRRLVYSYSHAIHGFAARLSKDELRAVKEMDGFIHVHRDREFNLRTTHSPDFLGLQSHHCFWKDSGFGNGVIIGVLDTGVVPYHPSFLDDDMPLPPSKWKGACDFDVPICNNKLIGARGFSKGCRDSPTDEDGHGTHTASVAGGNFVERAQVLGQAKGVASGIAPRAHVAVYKVCHKTCRGIDVLAGIDQAIADGVDVLSISAGANAEPFYDDSIAIGALSAIASGIFVSLPAGNAGPCKGSTENEAPWLLTVGASNMDRAIGVLVKLGNGIEIRGETAYQPDNFPATQLPLVYPGAKGVARAKTCSDGSLDGTNVRGKVVLCDTGGVNTDIEKGDVVRKAGGVAMILLNRRQEMFTIQASSHVIPAAHVSYNDAAAIKAYMKSSPTTTAAIIFDGTRYGTPPAPTVASFSGRGPSAINNGILKPDIIGPGVNVVAAWPLAVGPNPTNDTLFRFNIISGTSIATAHLAGVAALLKASHPEWSPAAIKSAIMTSSDTLNTDGKAITDETSTTADYFALGAGHVNPTRANDPGLIYDITVDDYISYLCGLGYTDVQVSAIARSEIKCLSRVPIAAEELNYPTFSVTIAAESQKTVTRTVTNVGEANAVYSVQVDAPKGVEVSVYPDKLEFSDIFQTAVYDVYFTTGGDDDEDNVGLVSQGQLRWISGKHVVRSPISVTFV